VRGIKKEKNSIINQRKIRIWVPSSLVDFCDLKKKDGHKKMDV
jgi:hypothetical protein